MSYYNQKENSILYLEQLCSEYRMTISNLDGNVIFSTPYVGDIKLYSFSKIDDYFYISLIKEEDNKRFYFIAKYDLDGNKLWESKICEYSDDVSNGREIVGDSDFIYITVLNSYGKLKIHKYDVKGSLLNVFESDIFYWANFNLIITSQGKLLVSLTTNEFHNDIKRFEYFTYVFLLKDNFEVEKLLRYDTEINEKCTSRFSIIDIKELANGQYLFAAIQTLRIYADSYTPYNAIVVGILNDELEIVNQIKLNSDFHVYQCHLLITNSSFVVMGKYLNEEPADFVVHVLNHELEHDFSRTMNLLGSEIKGVDLIDDRVSVFGLNNKGMHLFNLY